MCCITSMKRVLITVSTHLYIITIVTALFIQGIGISYASTISESESNRHFICNNFPRTVHYPTGESINVGTLCNYCVAHCCCFNTDSFKIHWLFSYLPMRILNNYFQVYPDQNIKTPHLMYSSASPRDSPH